jgi:RNA polymerase sigma factor (sigma-70 family)
MLVNMAVTDLELLGQFTREQSQDAFTALVNRHLNLVYSAALREVRSQQLAEEVCQSVFNILARNAGKLAPDTILSAWLYQVTRNAAVSVVRSEARRQAREQIAFQMSDMNESSASWAHIEPLLDEAMDSLDSTDRAAILLRYFENKSLREVGEALGTGEDAAQKRVSRAVERLREFLSKNKVAVGAGALTAVVSANAIQAAPAGLAGTIATGAVLASAAISTSTSIAITKSIAIAMTATQKAIIAAVAAGAIIAGVYQARQVSNLRGQVQTLQQQQVQEAALTNEVQQLQSERDRATNDLAALSAENAALKKHPTEVLKLRGEVGRLRQENADIGSTSALSKLTANPETMKMVRDQQKAGMGMIYKGFAKQMNLTSDQTEALNNLLADYVMDNVGHVAAVLRDKPPADQVNQIFAGQEAQLEDQIQALIGADGLTQYREYTKNLLGTLTGDQFESQLSGTDAEKKAKSQQISQVMQEDAGAALSTAGLPADYQTVPMLNFPNIASAQAGDQSLVLLSNIYQSAAARAGSFLSPDEITKFQAFAATAVNNNKVALTMNRTLMAPISK